MLNIFVFGYVGAQATFPGKDGDIEDEDSDKDTELSETGDEEPNPEEPKKGQGEEELPRFVGNFTVYIASLTLLSQIVRDNKKSREKRCRR